jgi:predicted RNA methylase
LFCSALELSNCSVYSLHKTSTREHIVKKAQDWGVKATVLAQLRYDLKGGKYKHHKKDTLDIEVDMYQFIHIKK